jgi:hypothetical protein
VLRNVTEWSGERAHEIPTLKGVQGSLRIDVRDRPFGVMHIDDGRAWFVMNEEKADSVVVVDDADDFELILKGELNPFMAAIQGRVAFQEHNSEFTIRVLFALAAAKTARPGQPAGEDHACPTR